MLSAVLPIADMMQISTARFLLTVELGDESIFVARAERRCAIVVFFRDARVAMIEKGAGQVWMVATIDGGGRGAGSSEQMRRDVCTDCLMGELRDRGAEVLGGQLPPGC
jgi:hypothetical protein